jgi:hypothetical protein
MIGTTRTTRLAITALLIGAAALAFDAGRTTGRASCQPTQHSTTLTRAIQ